MKRGNNGMRTIISNFMKTQTNVCGGGGIPVNIISSNNEYCILGDLQRGVFW